jgi:hypothetical protein
MTLNTHVVLTVVARAAEVAEATEAAREAVVAAEDAVRNLPR